MPRIYDLIIHNTLLAHLPVPSRIFFILFHGGIYLSIRPFSSFMSYLLTRSLPPTHHPNVVHHAPPPKQSDITGTAPP